MNVHFSLKHLWKLYPYKKKHLREELKLELNRDTYVKKSEISTHKFAVDYYVFCLIITSYFKEVLLSMFEGDTVSIGPLGILQIEKSKSMAVDWQKSKQRQEKVYFHNTHSDGFVARVRWKKFKAKFRNRNIFMFKLTANNRSKLKDLIKDNADQIYKYIDKKLW